MDGRPHWEKELSEGQGGPGTAVSSRGERSRRRAEQALRPRPCALQERPGSRLREDRARQKGDNLGGVVGPGPPGTAGGRPRAPSVLGCQARPWVRSAMSAWVSRGCCMHRPARAWWAPNSTDSLLSSGGQKSPRASPAERKVPARLPPLQALGDPFPCLFQLLEKPELLGPQPLLHLRSHQCAVEGFSRRSSRSPTLR